VEGADAVSMYAHTWALYEVECPPLAKLVLLLMTAMSGPNYTEIDDRLFERLEQTTGLSEAEIAEQLIVLLERDLLVMPRPGILWFNHGRDDEPIPDWWPGDPPKYLSRADRERIFTRDGWRCRTCGTIERLQVDHVIPRSRGGSNADENLQTLCQPCNIRKGAKLL
jgi:hypothetical protein